ncbi:MAG: ABC transporter permease subunit [Treponema sp.]|jgi:putative aldouronate transport system permease protein|nr:ABC transporter permease subunit [Treponema sp.]
MIGKNSIPGRILRDKWLYVLVLPGLIYYIVFKLVPMFGIIVAFQTYNPYTGFLNSPFAGWKNFRDFFTHREFLLLFKNTLYISFLNIVFYFPAPIILSLLLNEVQHGWYKRGVQTLVYIPHFLSWVIVYSLFYMLLTTDGGIINLFVEMTTGRRIRFLEDPAWFRPIVIVQTIWKETGWGTIIFLAALAGVDIEQYEAAIVDGAGRLRQLWHITLPAIKSTIVILLILRMGSVLNTGFDQIYLLMNSLNRPVANVFDVYVYEQGITRGSFSFATAVSLFKSIIGMILVYGTNYIAKKAGETGIF